MHKGKVKWYNQIKGFGFLIDSVDNAEYYFHVSKTMYEPVKDNDEVTFDLVKSKRYIGKEEAVHVNTIEL